jgi:hypothetical protein
MADQQPAFTAYAVTKREGKDDWWTPIGAGFPHKDGTGYNIVPNDPARWQNRPTAAEGEAGGRRAKAQLADSPAKS